MKGIKMRIFDKRNATELTVKTLATTYTVKQYDKLIKWVYDSDLRVDVEVVSEDLKTLRKSNKRIEELTNTSDKLLNYITSVRKDKTKAEALEKSKLKAGIISEPEEKTKKQLKEEKKREDKLLKYNELHSKISDVILKRHLKISKFEDSISDIEITISGLLPFEEDRLVNYDKKIRRVGTL